MVSLMNVGKEATSSFLTTKSRPRRRRVSTTVAVLVVLLVFRYQPCDGQNNNNYHHHHLQERGSSSDNTNNNHRHHHIDFVQAVRFGSVSSIDDDDNDDDMEHGFTWLADIPPPLPSLSISHSDDETHYDDDDDDDDKNSKHTNEEEKDRWLRLQQQQQQQDYQRILDRCEDLLTRYWPYNRNGYSYHQQQQHLQQQQDQQDQDQITLKDSNDNSTNSDSNPFTYGEVTPLGVRQLVYEMGGLSLSSSSSSSSSIVFMDVGSGVGKLIVQIYLEYVLPTQVPRPSPSLSRPFSHPRLIGVELSKQRHDVAVDGWDRVQHELRSDDVSDPSRCHDGLYCGNGDDVDHRGVQFLHSDALDVDYSTVTHIFMSSLCFPDHVLAALQIQLLQSAPNLHVVASLNRLDEFLSVRDGSSDDNNDNKSSTVWMERTVPIQMSWGPSTAKIYQRTKPSEKTGVE